MLLDVLACLLLKVVVRSFDPAGETCAVVLRSERLESELRSLRLLGHLSPRRCLYRRAAAFTAALGAGGFNRAFTNTLRASPRRLSVSKSLMVFVAACWALTTTNSVTDVPRSSAARSMMRFCSRVTLASRRSSFLEYFRALTACSRSIDTPK